MALGPLNIEIPSIPQMDVGDYVPDFIRQPRRAPLTPNQPRAVSAFQNKYAEGSYFAALEQSGIYAPHAINALRNYDQDRVRRGQAPLTEAQTQSALQAATNQEQVTKEPKRSLNPFKIPGNLIKDAGDILKSLPRLPGALINEVKELPNAAKVISEADNPLVGLAQAPGFRMLPGAFLLENIAGGTPGELLRHPLFTGLDVLPIANKAAAGTKVATKASAIAKEFSAAGTVGGVLAEEGTALFRQGLDSQKLAKRPLKAAMFRTLDNEGQIVKNTAGEMAEVIAKTKLGQGFAGTFGQVARDAQFAVNMGAQRVMGIFHGTLDVPDNVLAPYARQADEYQAKFDELGVDHAEMWDRLSFDKWDTPDPKMLEAMELTRDFNGRLATTLAQNNFTTMFNNETYDLGKGNSLKQAERGLDNKRKLTNQRGAVETAAIDPASINPTNVVNDMLGALRRPRPHTQTIPGVRATNTPVDQISANDLTMQHNIMVRQLRSAGYDTVELQKAWDSVEGRSKGKPRKDGSSKAGVDKNPAVYESLLQEVAANPSRLPKLNMLSVDDAIAKLKTLAKSPVTKLGAKDILFGIENRNWQLITKGVEQLRRTDAWADEALITRLRDMRDSGKFVQSKLSPYTAKALKTKERNFNQLVAEAVPSRFIPELERQTKARSRERALNVNTVEQAAKINELADQGLWEKIPNFSPDMYRKIQREAAREWQTWRDRGFNPTYLHSVAPNKANAAVHPYASIVPRSASSVKKRAWDMAPSVHNVGLSMTHQMMELLSREQIELSLKSIMDQMGETEIALRERFAPAAQRRAQTNTALDMEGHLQVMINERFMKFDPDLEGYTWGSPYLSRLKQDKVFIPKQVGKNLKSLADPKRLMGGLLDPVTNVFRTSVVSLSLRTQVYNLLGGAISIGPEAMFRSSGRARAMMKDPTLIPAPLRAIMGSTKAQLMDLSRESMGAVNEGVWAHLRMKTLGRIFDGEQANKVPGRAITRFKNGITGIAEKSYTLNSKVDDFYRMTTFIDNYDKAIRAGSNVADAERKAIVAVRNNLQDWMSMTPVERSVIRSIIPFYGYMGHAMRFVLRYPFDHPIRTEMMSKLAMAELEDNESIPGRFMSMLFLGGVGPNGEQNAINAGPFNPFGDIANYMTFQGMLGATNPVIQTMLETVGIQDGKAELYPSLRYDSLTGRLSSKGNNPLTSLLQNTLPQSQVITAMLGINEEYKDMVRRDPASAQRYLASGLTIPITWRQINVDQEIMKAEIARQDAQEKVKNEALKSGDWQEALMYPSLAGYINAMDDLTPEQKAPYLQLTKQQLAALSQGDAGSTTALPQFAGVEPLDMTIDTLMNASKTSPILQSNLTGTPLPGSSLNNTTGGT